MNAILRKEILSETYEDMQGLIFETAWRFWNSHGGDIDEYIAEANLLFIKAFDCYDESKSKLTTWVVTTINNGLRDFIRTEYRQTHVSMSDEFESQSSKGFSVMELLDEMERDCHTIIQLFLETPQEILLSALADKNRRGVKGLAKNRLKNRLRQMGWTICRIKKAFEEIKTVISY